ncbi:MAG: HIT domain-containing protein [Gemmatimonadota bacterium]|jgi:ATP adenylyltransferase|nr:HIT domain-containing protein [Gemmatimonadota bacterium]MDP6802793.1 HIT domain-containing protein [Gemmatimonadota bacterium]MDP7032726.1 HIT domain-containing protein [Gemmatimonadota bacterium]
MSGRDAEGTLLTRLWATWRMKYIRSIGEPTDGCIFCTLLEEEDGPGNLVLHRGDTCFVVLNLYPYNNGHMMVVPKRHVSEFGEFSSKEASEVMELAALMQRVLDSTHQPHGFNLGMNLGRVAGAGIPDHLHLHLVPRWTGDTNFMPVTAETKVLPEALEATWSRIREGVIAELEKKEGAE